MIALKRKQLVPVLLILSAIFAISIYAQPVFALEDQNSMSSTMGMCSTMMNKVPKDVVIRSMSSQVATVGKQAEITVLVLDKKTSKPVIDADLPIMIERGPPMSSMDMMGQMFAAEKVGNGKYIVKFTPDKKGVYTIHTHVIPPRKSMMSMMDNHMDIGIIAK